MLSVRMSSTPILHTVSLSFPLFLAFPLTFIPPPLSLSLSLPLEHIFLLAPALSHKHARTYPWKKKRKGRGGEEGRKNEMHE